MSEAVDIDEIDKPELNLHDPQQRQLNKYRMKKFKGAKAPLPSGAMMDATRFLNVRPPGTKNAYALSNIEEFMLHRKPGYRYGWRERGSDETIGMVEAHRIRPVLMSEIIRCKETAGLFGFAGADGRKYVGWKRMALFEVPPDIAYELWQYPVDWAIKKTIDRQDEVEDKIGEYSRGKMEVNKRATAFGVDPARRDEELRNPRGRHQPD